MKKITMTRQTFGTEASNGTLTTYYPDQGDPEGYMRGVGCDYEINGQQEAYDAMLADSRNWAIGESRELVIYNKYDNAPKTQSIPIAPKVHGVNGWCDKCRSYCWGDCEAN
jgi:hypothetical protein